MIEIHVVVLFLVAAIAVIVGFELGYLWCRSQDRLEAAAAYPVMDPETDTGPMLVRVRQLENGHVIELPAGATTAQTNVLRHLFDWRDDPDLGGGAA